MFCPQYYKIVSGYGEAEFELVSFDKALINAGVSNYNRVKVSSILPAHCVHRETIDLPEGSILFAAYACISIKEVSASAAVSISFPDDDNECGVIFEASGICLETDIRERVKNMGVRAIMSRNEKLQKQAVASAHVSGNGEKYATAFAAVVMW